MKTGIFSGTFDPVHTGHLAFSQAAIRAGGLDQIILLPEAEPRGKTGVTALKHRLAMLDLATKDSTKLSILTLPSRQLTVKQTLPELREQFAHDELTLLVGSDVAKTFAHRWPGLEKLFAEMKLIIGLRQADSQAEIEALMQELQQSYSVKIDYQCIASPKAHAASAHARTNTSDEHVAPRVAAYIAKNHLYGA